MGVLLSSGEVGGHIGTGVLLLVVGLFLLIMHKAVERMFLMYSDAGRKAAEYEPWPWWRWPRPTERWMRNMA